MPITLVKPQSLHKVNHFFENFYLLCLMVKTRGEKAVKGKYAAGLSRVVSRSVGAKKRVSGTRLIPVVKCRLMRISLESGLFASCFLPSPKLANLFSKFVAISSRRTNCRNMLQQQQAHHGRTWSV